MSSHRPSHPAALEMRAERQLAEGNYQWQAEAARAVGVAVRAERVAGQDGGRAAGTVATAVEVLEESRAVSMVVSLVVWQDVVVEEMAVVRTGFRAGSWVAEAIGMG